MLRFRYGQIEQAIAQAHGVPNDPDTMKTFRGRVRNFQKLGLVPSAPGKGQKVSYGLDDAVTWALCFELAEASLPPNAITQVIETIGKQVQEFFTTVRLDRSDQDITADRDVYLVIEGNFLRWNFTALPAPFLAKLEFLDRLVLDGMPDRVTLINLSAMKRRFSTALSAQVTIEDPSSSEPGTIQPFSAF